jgi:hypothetical protein
MTEYQHPLSPIPGQILSSDGRVGSGSSFATMAAARLCGNDMSASTGCELTLLCTQCGVQPTLHMKNISYTPSGVHNGSALGDQLKFTTTRGMSQILMPPMIVLDAVSVLRASQREAVLPGTGLSGPIRPLQGPICRGCECDKGYECDIDQSVSTDRSVGSGSSLNSSPKCISYTMSPSETNDFAEGHSELLEDIKRMNLGPTPGCSTGPSALVLRRDCRCRSSTSASPCVNRDESHMMPTQPVPGNNANESHMMPTQPVTGNNANITSSRVNSFSLVVGFVAAAGLVGVEHEDTTGPVEQDDVGGEWVDESATSLGEAYEICIVDTRYQHMCRLSRGASGSEPVFLKDGIAGQFHYQDHSNTCAPDVCVVAAHEVDSSSNQERPATTACMVNAHVVNPMYGRTKLSPPRHTSCVVCCTLLDTHDGNVDTGPFVGGSLGVHPNIYLPAYHNWAHYDCTVPCERKISGVCMGQCPRLNTFVSTMFDISPRFENLCPPCIRHGDPSSVSDFSSKFKPPAYSSSSGVSCNLGSDTYFNSASYAPSMLEEPTELRMDSRPTISLHTPSTFKKHPPNKSSPSNWLSAASVVRKKAALNIPDSKLTPKQLKERRAASAFKVDKSGIYTNKKHDSWYRLDEDGNNPSPVSGLPFFDEVFGEVRVWSCLQEREREVASYRLLHGRRDM